MPTPNHEINSVEYKQSLLGKNTTTILGISSVEDITVLNGWRQLGAETYVTDFLLATDNLPLHLIAKACIKIYPGAVVREWLGRRQKLRDNGVVTPTLFAVEAGTIVEEFIPFDFVDAYQCVGDEGKKHLQEAYVNTYKRVVGAGFVVASFCDVRSHGDDVVVIDVGEDLGAPFEITSCDLSAAQQAGAHFERLVSGI